MTATPTLAARENGIPESNGGLLGYVPALDGLRGLAVVLVLLFHFVGHQGLPGGWVGVDVFFVLSGFLITTLLVQEHQEKGRISLSQFASRRAARLFPALAFMLAIWCILLVIFHDYEWFGETPARDAGRPVDPQAALSNVWHALAYAANWDVIHGGMAAPLEHLWSLAVEEQFYLVWPVVLLALSRRSPRVCVVVTLLLALASAALPLLYWDGGRGAERIYFGTDTRAVELLAGALTGWAARSSRGRFCRSFAAAAVGWFGLIVILAIAVDPPSQRCKSLWSASILAIAATALILALLPEKGLLPLIFSHPALRWTGRRSYALYLWHYLWATWTHPMTRTLALTLGVTGTVLCGELSWRLVEQPALAAAKRRLRPMKAEVRSS